MQNGIIIGLSILGIIYIILCIYLISTKNYRTKQVNKFDEFRTEANKRIRRKEESIKEEPITLDVSSGGIVGSLVSAVFFLVITTSVVLPVVNDTLQQSNVTGIDISSVMGLATLPLILFPIIIIAKLFFGSERGEM